MKEFLAKLAKPTIKLSFTQIEYIIHDTLPPSASKHSEAWWSNNRCHSPAIAWIDAGYETDYVSDTYKENDRVQ